MLRVMVCLPTFSLMSRLYDYCTRQGSDLMGSALPRTFSGLLFAFWVEEDPFNSPQAKIIPFFLSYQSFNDNNKNKQAFFVNINI